MLAYCLVATEKWNWYLQCWAMFRHNWQGKSVWSRVTSAVRGYYLKGALNDSFWGTKGCKCEGLGKRERLEAINCHFLRLIETTGTSLRPEFTTNSHISSTPLYVHWFNCALQYFHCHNHELIVDIILIFKTMTDFCKFIRLYNLKL